MGKRLFLGEIDLPQPKSLPGCPFDPVFIYLLGDEIFSLKMWFMCPHPGKMLQSRPRRVIENTFDILMARWRIFNTPINASVEIVEKYVMATVVLQIYLRQIGNQIIVPLVL